MNERIQEVEGPGRRGTLRCFTASLIVANFVCTFTTPNQEQRKGRYTLQFPHLCISSRTPAELHRMNYSISSLDAELDPGASGRRRYHIP